MVTDQAQSQDGSILAKFFFCIFMDQHEVEVHVDRTSLANKGFINLRELFLAGLTWEMPSGQDWPIFRARVANQNTGLASSCPLADSAI